MYDPEREYIETNLLSPTATLGQVADDWSPHRAVAEREAAQKILAAALHRLDSGDSVPLSEFLEETTGKQIDKELAGR